LVNIPSEAIAEEASINDEDKEGTKEPEIWSKHQSSRSWVLVPQQLITGTRRLTSAVEEELETLIPQSQRRLHQTNAA
jgi:hypothetical protein